jgi:hypothetical protein
MHLFTQSPSERPPEKPGDGCRLRCNAMERNVNAPVEQDPGMTFYSGAEKRT